MADYTLAYQASNGFTITAGSTHALTVNVYIMANDYTFTQLVTDEAVIADAEYDVDYDVDGVYNNETELII